jgi:hypothetical protein
MHRTLRIVSVALTFGAAACTGAENITGPQRTPTEIRQEGTGYMGGGGRSATLAPAGSFTAR